MFDRLRKWWARRSNAPVAPSHPPELTPYVVMLATPCSFNSDELKVDDWRGLLFVEFLGSGAGRDGCIVATWRDRAAYEAAEPRFLTAVHLAAGRPAWKGFHLGTRQAGKGRFGRPTVAQLWAGVATFFLALGYLEKLREDSGWLFGPPACDVDDREPIDVLLNGPIVFDLQARNLRKLGECSIRFTGLSVEPPGALELVPLRVRFYPSVKSGEGVRLNVSGKAVRPGEHKVIITGEAEAGLFPSNRRFDGTVVVRVWPEWEVSAGRRLEVREGGKSCVAGFKFKVGGQFDDGFVAQAKLVRVAEVVIAAVGFPNVYEVNFPPVQKRAGFELATVEWKTSRIPPWSEIPFTLILKADRPRSRDDWEEVVSQKHLECLFDPVRKGRS
jgi:hypothetical protein